MLKVYQCLLISSGDNLGNQCNRVSIYFPEWHFHATVWAWHSNNLIDYVLLNVRGIHVSLIDALDETFFLLCK